MNTPVTTDLAGALSALDAAGSAAGLDSAEVRDEGIRLAAAVAESAIGAAPAWMKAVGPNRFAAGELDAFDPFFDAASSARRWRSAPTELLTQLVASSSPAAADYARALTGVIAAASELGEPSMGVLGAASATAAAQLAAARVPRTPPGSFPEPTTPFPEPATPFPEPVEGHDPRADALRQAQGTGQAQGAEAEAAAAPEPEKPAKTLEELLAELDGLIGLDRVKTEIHRQTQLLRIDQLRTAAGLTTPTLTRHLVFLGNPGTGKTTVARLVSGIYRALGILSKGHLIEVDRSELVAGYLGQTASKTSDVIGTARGGVLFIDEAYGLALDQYGAEAITTLVKDMEDHRDDLVVIVAGYPEPMQAFMETNPGLASRFAATIDFDDYSDAELEQIFVSMAEGSDFDPTPECLTRFGEIVAAEPRGEGFGNGRYARNLLDAAISRHAWRLRDVKEPTIDELRQLWPEDLSEAAEARAPEPTDAETTDAATTDAAATDAPPADAESTAAAAAPADDGQEDSR